MPGPRDYADTFRALGRFLEMVGATQVRIDDDGEHMDVSWRGKTGRHEDRRYTDLEIQALRTTVRLFRGIDGGTPPVTPSELLRTIGRELDDAGVSEVIVEEVADGFVVWAGAGNGRLSRHHSIADLVARARDLHADRFRETILMRDPVPAVPSSWVRADPGLTISNIRSRRLVASVAG